MRSNASHKKRASSLGSIKMMLKVREPFFMYRFPLIIHQFLTNS